MLGTQYSFYYICKEPVTALFGAPMFAAQARAVLRPDGTGLVETVAAGTDAIRIRRFPIRFEDLLV